MKGGRPRQRDARSAERSRPGERGDHVQPGELVRVADGVDARDAAVLDGEAHRCVERAADLDAGGRCVVEPDSTQLELVPAGSCEEEGGYRLRAFYRVSRSG